MKTLRVSDEVHRELTRLLGEMIAQSRKPQTYNDIIRALITRSALCHLKCSRLKEIRDSTEGNRQFAMQH